MKTYNLIGLLAISLFCVLPTSFSAQSALVVSNEAKAIEVIETPSIFEYSDISLSDPTIYRDEPFSISLMVKNTSGKEAKHEVRLLQKDETAPKGLRKKASKFLALRPGQSEMVTFTFKAADLMEALENMPEMFVFSLGEFEIGVGYEN
jgi:hypothetical protein